MTVSGIGGTKHYVKTFPEIVLDFFNVPGTIWNMLGMNNKGREVDILSNFRGVVKPGEMVLVLGRPGSGCTTFLKVIANQRKGYTKVDGEVSYGRFSADTFSKRFRGEAVYNEEGMFCQFAPTKNERLTSPQMMFTILPSRSGRPSASPSTPRPPASALPA